jgi:hypothetical protein
MAFAKQGFARENSKSNIAGHWVISVDTLFTLDELVDNSRTVTLVRKAYSDKLYEWGGGALIGIEFNTDGNFVFLSNVMCSTESMRAAANGTWASAGNNLVFVNRSEADFSLRILSSSRKKMIVKFEKKAVEFIEDNVKDSLDMALVTKYLLDRHHAVKAFTSRSRNNLLTQWEDGPHKMDSPEVQSSLKPGWRVYSVCSYAHGIPSPNFKMTLFIDDLDSIHELKYDDVTLFNQALKSDRKATDVKPMSLAIMQILTSQFCVITELPKDAMKVTKEKGKLVAKIEIGHGYRVEKDPAYWWWIEFDKNMNCTKAWFRADLPPVP